jgi:hypothetical protein
MEQVGMAHVRRASGTETDEWSDNGWPRDIGVHGLFDVPLRQICFRTSSPEIKRYLEEARTTWKRTWQTSKLADSGMVLDDASKMSETNAGSSRAKVTIKSVNLFQGTETFYKVPERSKNA